MVSNDCQLKDAEKSIRQIRASSASGRKSPHKFLLLLSLINLYEEDSNRANRFPLDETLEYSFRSTCSALLPPEISGKIFIEYPYYHLSSDGIWDFHFVHGKEALFDNYQNSNNMRLTRKRLTETVSYASLAANLDACFRKPLAREKLSELLHSCISSANYSLVDNKESQSPKEASLFAHEEEAISAISARIAAANLGRDLSNLEIHEPQSNRYFEIDFLAVCRFGIYVVELKHWSGHIEIRADSWIQNGSFYKSDPHKNNSFKAKLIRGIYERKFPSYPGLFVESVVVFTNPDTLVDGATVPSTGTNNPTFESIDRFIEFLKYQRDNKPHRLDNSQVEAFANYLNKLAETPRPRDFIFPGYEIVERLYQHVDRAEIVARPTVAKHRLLSRLRLFFPPSGEDSRFSRARRERATATLDAIAKIGDHPNILKVWNVPNDYGYTVEGSDWSETGRLKDYLIGKVPLPSEKAIEIVSGILNGLEAAHKQDVIHRNLSPESILMAGDTPKLMNFDLSYQLEDDERVTVIPDTSELKRSAYMAPEIYMGGPLSESADLFSVGVMLYEMFTGERPFSCSTDLQHTKGRLTQLSIEKLAKKSVSRRLIALIYDLVQMDSKERPSGVKDVVSRLVADSEKAPSPPKAVNPELSPGTSHDVFEIVELLKHGAESQIYEAKGPRGSLALLKIFNSDVPMPRILNEQHMGASVRHPAIVRVGDIHRWEDGRFYLRFDWISGKALRKEIEEGVRPTLSRFEHVAKQMLNVLEKLHGYRDEEEVPAPILHNDIKPDNILLNETNQAFLVDFGTASHPHIGLYSGTEGYVAPDLRRGQDRSYNEDGDLFGLGVTLFEWFFSKAPYEQAMVGSLPQNPSEIRSDLPANLENWFLRTVATDSSRRFASALEMADSLKRALMPEGKIGDQSVCAEKVIEPQPEPKQNVLTISLDQADESIISPPQAEGNLFVSYLNSLHSLDGDSENALAESQAINPSFSLIHVSHPIADMIKEGLLQSDKHFILTGHAGDGKSTIGVEIYKSLMGIAPDEPLEENLPDRVEVGLLDQKIVIIKDLSEWSKEDQKAILLEAMKNKGTRFLIITNTGTLLETFVGYEKESRGDWMAIESDILKSLEKAGEENFFFHDISFAIINLAMLDNLKLAEQIFSRMIDADRWSACEKRDCRNHCPIYRNVSLISSNKPVVQKRIFLLYRRLYEYGSRFTLRQLTGHLAYMITSGVTYGKVLKMGKKASLPKMTDFMFFNRFFGDSGRKVDEAAIHMPVVGRIREARFGSRPCPSWERRLWSRAKGETFAITAEACKDDFSYLREVGIGFKAESEMETQQARDQVRRMLFFLHDFEENDDGSYPKTFLDSPMIMAFMAWQEASKPSLSLVEKTDLKKRIIHVLQEHFTGVRLPEGSIRARDDLFITLSRRSHEIRQSAQVVLARISEDDLALELVEQMDALGNKRRTLRFRGRKGRINASLPLDLPFLDYVMLRNQGEMGSVLLPSYVDRLDRFRGRLIKQAAFDRGDDIMLVRLRTNHTFRRQVFSVHEERLEVTDG
jgi:serine/threonine protein kinase